MNSITSADLIIELKEIFSYHGLCDQIVSDNGPSLTSKEFMQSCSANGIEHITTLPYHPAVNGLAERAVGIFKKAMIKLGSKFSLRERINRFLTKYPNITTGVTPAELLCSRKLKNHLTCSTLQCRNLSLSTNNLKRSTMLNIQLTESWEKMTACG